MRMQPWRTITGRLVDEGGKPIDMNAQTGTAPAASIEMDRERRLATNDDPTVGSLPEVKVDERGQFRIEPIIPGQRYTADLMQNGKTAGIAFEDLTLKPGEVRDLGDIRMSPQPAASAR